MSLQHAVGNRVVARLLQDPRPAAPPDGGTAIRGSMVGRIGAVQRLPGDDKLAPAVRKAKMEARALAIKGAPGPVIGRLKRELKAAAASHTALEPFEPRIVALEAKGKAALDATAKAAAAAAAKKKADAILNKAGLLGKNGNVIAAKLLTEVFANVATAVTALKAGTKTDWAAERIGRKWGDEHGNNEGHLPVGTWKEYYVEPKPTDEGVGPHRLVANGDLSRIYYSPTHYGQGGAKPAFVKLTGPGVDPPAEEAPATPAPTATATPTTPATGETPTPAPTEPATEPATETATEETEEE